MEKYTVMLGVPCYGMAQALTCQSLWDLASDNPIELGDELGSIEIEFKLHPFAIGPYVELHLISLLAAFLESGMDYMLRLDSDMCWDPYWPEHFFSRHFRTVEPNSVLQLPLIHGGVYPRRQRVQNYTPIVQWMYDEQPLTDEAFVERSRRFYIAGETHPAARVGGGWCLYNRAAAELPKESWYVKEGIGEDYGGCDAVRAAGGKVWATWPQAGVAQLGHAIGGLDFATISDYLTAWAVASGQPRQDVLTCEAPRPTFGGEE